MNADDTVIAIDGVTKRFGGHTVAVDDVTLDIRRGEFFALLGPSGCGKTTLLRMVAGFENPTAGEIRIDGQPMTGVQPNRRPVNMVFQSYAVFPHMTVADNVGYGLKVTGVRRDEIRSRVAKALKLVHLDGYDQRKPDQLSGGQRQRVALARALVKQPKVLLLDEPLSALDAKLRQAMQLELARLQHTLGLTFLMVTHDQDEALSMADRIAVLDHGRVQQVASPQDLYEHPANRFVADFIGKVNLLDATVKGHQDGHATVAIPDLGELRIPSDKAAAGPATVAVRPEKVDVMPDQPAAAEGLVQFRGTVEQVAYHGDSSLVVLALPHGATLTANLQNRQRMTAQRLTEGTAVWATWRTEDSVLLTG